jgi:RNA polymerase sigma-70 factor, ECF subfamily
MIEACEMEIAQILDRDYRMSVAKETVPDILDSDARLMLRFKDGDEEAFNLLFARHTRAMINFAYRFVRDRQVAEELAQEIFLKVYAGAARYWVQSRFSTWLYRIATNVCLNEVRKPRFRTEHQPLSNGVDSDPVSPAIETANSADRRLERQAMARVLREALNGIPEKQRTAFILNKYQELSYAEVAEIMKTSEKAVKSLIHRARETLAERLKPLMPELLNR